MIVSSSKNELINLLSTCGQIAEHESTIFVKLGKNEENLLAGLAPEERDTLQAILTKLKSIWMEEHKKHQRPSGDKS